MAEKTVRGRFVWHELMTPETQGARAFYTKTLGWKTQAWEQDPSYSMFVGPNGPLGGSVALPAGAPRWLHYVGTPDIEATVERARSLGASVTKEVTGMPNGGKYAELDDPQGAAFALYQSPTEPAEEQAPKRGEFSWHELGTTDQAAAFEFYSALFGWETMAEHDMGEMGGGVYRIFGSNGVQRGGMYNMPPQMQGGPSWLGYVRVKDARQSVDKVKGARGTLINGPMEVPGGDWIAQFLDPYGAMFAVHATAADVKAAKPAAAKEAAPAEAAPAAQPAAKKATRRKAAGGKAAAKKPARKPAKRTVAKKAAKKKAGARKAAPKRKRAAAKSVKRPARKAAQPRARKAARKKVTVKRKRSGGKKRTAQKPRKGK